MNDSAPAKVFDPAIAHFSCASIPSSRGPDRRSRERGTLILDVGSVIRYCDRPAAGMFGVARENLVGKPVAALTPTLPLKAGTPGHNLASCHFHFAGGQWRRFQVLAPRGQRFDIEASVEHLKLPKAHQFLLGLRQPDERFEPRNPDLDRLERSLDNREDMALVTNLQGVIRYVNPAFQTATGYDASELVGQTPHMLSSGMHDRAFYTLMWHNLRQGRTFSALITNRKKNGELYHQETTIRPFLDQGGQISHFVLTGQDISRRIHALDRLEHLAHHDYLTGLPNRALFLDRLGQARLRAQREGGRFALLYIDLDGFKQVNDLAGHGAGDALLRLVAHHLSGCVREEDTVARMGGDEFSCLLAGVSDQEDVKKVCQKILAAVRLASLSAGPQGVRGTASIGVALYPDETQDESELLERADQAMYHAKNHGGDGCCSSRETPNMKDASAASGRVLRWESCHWR